MTIDPVPMNKRGNNSTAYPTLPCYCDVVIIGGGVAGASAAYHLAKSVKSDPKKTIIVLERGCIGEGLVASGGESTNSFTNNSTNAEDDITEELKFARSSGTNVLPSLRTIKQITRLYATSSTNFIAHHGREGARRYLTLSKLGMEYQKELASTLLPHPDTQLRCMGALYLTFDVASIPMLEEEFHLLQELGCSNIKFWRGKDQLRSIPGCPPLAEAGIFLPDDAIIDSVQYAKSLLRAAVAMGNVQVLERCPEVTAVGTTTNDTSNHHGTKVAITELKTGARIVSKHVVVATGGLFIDQTLAGILNPAWSYLVGIPHPELLLQSPNTNRQKVPKSSTMMDFASFSDGIPYNSCNFYTWGFTHDWCWSEGAVRVSGEDHYSAYKPPQSVTRCHSLTDWIRQSYPNVAFSPAVSDTVSTVTTTITTTNNNAQQYGVYSETPDKCPIVGQTSPNSPICYIVGCNAWGQAALSYCATLIPGLLGYETLDDTQKDLLSLVTIRRFSLLPSVLNSSKL